jgi:hypothetical protein
MKVYKRFKKVATPEQKRYADKIEIFSSIFGFLLIVWLVMGWITGSVKAWLYPLPIFFVLFTVPAIWHGVYKIGVVSDWLNKNNNDR